MARIVTNLWKNWLFKESFLPEYCNPLYDDSDFEQIQLPHTVKEVPYNYFDETAYQMLSCYRRHFSVPAEAQNSRIFLDFDGVMCAAEVWVNGYAAGSHKGGYTPFSIEITHLVHFGGSDNTVTVAVDSRERTDIPPFGFAVDYLTYGGIYRDVSLRIVPQCFIQSVYAKPDKILEKQKMLAVDIELNNCANGGTPDNADQTQQHQITVTLLDYRHKKKAEYVRNIFVSEAVQTVSVVLENLIGIALWSLEKPALYIVEVTLRTNDSAETDSVSTTIGFRTAAFTPDGFFLNGKRLVLRGLNRHQSFPYIGYAMPKRVQERDAEILKQELGVNFVRTSHYPQSPFFLNRCDELGLLVFEETPGWQHIGDEEWQAVSCQEIREMILRDRNHPSIVLWGVRINESDDCSGFYRETNRIAHELDPSRQTGGVRCKENSEFLEDVYTMNDFMYGSHAPGAHHMRILRPQREVTGLDSLVPYLVTEFAGHIYPTKRFDQEERLVEHACRHAAVHNAAALDPHKCGAIGWCAFDYNTHANFGSGDRICYHGVMDMFRMPKFAAAVYASQQPASVQPVMEPLTRYTIGERAIGGIAPLMICTNCDKVRIRLGENDLGYFYPAFDRYPGLPHPPIVIENIETAWGQNWTDAVFTGFYQEVVCIERQFVPNPVPTQLVLAADAPVLSAVIPDAVRCTVRLLDQAGNELPYSTEVIKITIKGAAQLIGDADLALIGGVRAFWIKALGQTGTVHVTVSSARFKSNTVKIKIR
ncbi:MAG: glycoside hydrolase family 2 protein [Treponema sp.]